MSRESEVYNQLFDGVTCKDMDYYTMLVDETSYIEQEIKNVTYPFTYLSVSFWFYRQKPKESN